MAGIRSKIPVFKRGETRPQVDVGPIFIEDLGVIYFDAALKYDHSMTFDSDFIGKIVWYGGNQNQIPDGYALLNGQIANRLNWPELWAFVDGGGWSLLDDTAWLADVNGRNSFSRGNGSTTFRFPDFNAYQFGSPVSLAGVWSAEGVWIIKASGAYTPVGALSLSAVLSMIDQKLSIIDVNKSSLYDYSWHNGPRSTISPGCIPTDGQRIDLSVYPEACLGVWGGKQHAVTEAEWQSDPTKRNCWSRGDGSSWVRVPDLNAAVAGTGKPFYLRGGADTLNGSSVGDAIRNITGEFKGLSAPDGTLFTDAGSSSPNLNGGSASYTRILRFDASAVVPTADENRVKTAYGVWTVRVFTEVSNVGALDAGKLATQLGVVDAKVQELDANTGFTIIYPNGGTEAAPANIATGSRYISENPFPGHNVIVVAEVFYNGEWGHAGWLYSSSGQGTTGAMHNGRIVVQTGAGATITSSQNGGSSFGLSASVSTPVPCRVKVWKVKGSAA